MKRLRKLPISSIIDPCGKQNDNTSSGGTMDIIQKIKEELQVEDILSKFNEISIECGN